MAFISFAAEVDAIKVQLANPFLRFDAQLRKCSLSEAGRVLNSSGTCRLRLTCINTR
jgi:hypothetical protein